MSPFFINYHLSPMSYSMTGAHGLFPSNQPLHENEMLLQQTNTNLQHDLERAKREIDLLTQRNKDLSDTNIDLRRQLQTTYHDSQSSADRTQTFEFSNSQMWRSTLTDLRKQFFRRFNLYEQETFYKNRDSPNAYGTKNYEDYLRVFINKKHPEILKKLDEFNGRYRSTSQSGEKFFDFSDNQLKYFNILFEDSYGKPYLSKEDYRNMALQIFWSYFVSDLMKHAREDNVMHFIETLRTSLKNCVNMKQGFQKILKYPHEAIYRTKAVCEYSNLGDDVHIFCYWDSKQLKLTYKFPDSINQDQASEKEAMEKYIADNLRQHQDWPQNFDLYILYRPQ